MAAEDPKITDWLGVALALLALSQPWVIAAWKRFASRPRVKIYPHRFIEIGYSGFGATITLRGSLRCENRDVFVHSMGIEVIRSKDGAKKKLDWFAKKEERAIFASSGASATQEETSVSMPTGFLIGPTIPVAVSNFFCDAQFLQEATPLLSKLKAEWTQHIGPSVSSVGTAGFDSVTEITEFSKKSGTVGALLEYIDQEFFWLPGAYQLVVSAEIDGHASVKKVIAVDLSSEDSRKLKGNKMAVLFEACMGRGTYHFCHIKV